MDSIIYVFNRHFTYSKVSNSCICSLYIVTKAHFGVLCMQKQKPRWVIDDAFLLISHDHCARSQACVCHSGGQASCELDAQQLKSQPFLWHLQRRPHNNTWLRALEHRVDGNTGILAATHQHSLWDLVPEPFSELYVNLFTEISSSHWCLSSAVPCNFALLWARETLSRLYVRLDVNHWHYGPLYRCRHFLSCS